MERVIKFRAWSDRHKKFIYWGFMNGGFTGIPSGEYSIEECQKRSQQFTGLKDKDNVEIYEGDILKTINGDWGVMVWKAPFFELTVSETHSSLYGREWLSQGEVIGDVYSNPELLQ